MFTRTALMFVFVVTLCGAAFTLGGLSSRGRQDAGGILAGHPVFLAFRFERELSLSDDQIQKLTALREGLEGEFAPFRAQADSIQNRMREQPQSGGPDSEAGKQLKREGDALGQRIQPMLERYAKEVGTLLTDEQRQKLMMLSRATEHPSDEHEFVLDTIMKSREQLAITPPQFTKLQYLLADFIRAFAPVREKMEILQIEIQDKFAKAGKAPAPEYAERVVQIQKQVAALQSRFSERAIADVLEPKQRTKLEELLHEVHGPAPTPAY